MAPVPIRVVRPDGAVERLGEWDSSRRALRLERDGFPFLGAGEHVLEGELPWIFWDMCPAGFLGQLLHRSIPELSLPPNPALWGADAVMRLLTRRGEDLAGNLLLGDESWERWQAWTFQPANLARQIDAVLAVELSGTGTVSSLGGDRPKVLATRADGTASLIKFSPLRSAPAGERWADLLRVEAHCSAVLRGHGIEAASSRAAESQGRMTLHVERFDRLKNRGRVGAGTLFWLSAERFGDVDVTGVEVVRRLEAEGALTAGAVETIERVQAFSEAIGNNDTHLGNYGLLFDERGRARLAPIYDVLPMVFAPRHDELPDAYVAPRASPVDERVSAWVDDLRDLVEGDEEISPGFKSLWRRYLGVARLSK